MLPTVRQIQDEIATLLDGEHKQIYGVDVRKHINCWWVQAGGGVTFHRSAFRAAQAAKRLMKVVNEVDE